MVSSTKFLRSSGTGLIFEVGMPLDGSPKGPMPCDTLRRGYKLIHVLYSK